MPNLQLIVAVITGILFVLAIGQAVVNRSRKAPLTPPDPGTDDTAPAIQWLPAIAIPVITLAYAALLAWHVADFRITTTVFIISAGVVFAEQRAKALRWVVPIALVFSLGLHYLFTAVLVIDLP